MANISWFSTCNETNNRWDTQLTTEEKPTLSSSGSGLGTTKSTAWRISVRSQIAWEKAHGGGSLRGAELSNGDSEAIYLGPCNVEMRWCLETTCMQKPCYSQKLGGV